MKDTTLTGLLTGILSGDIRNEGQARPYLNESVSLLRHKSEPFAVASAPIGAVYLLASGTCRVLISSDNGKEMTADVMPAPQIYGLCELMTDRSEFGATVIPAAGALILRVNRDHFLSRINEDFEVCRAVARYLAVLAVRNMDRVESGALLTQKEQFALYLLHAARAQSFPCTIMERRQDMAAHLHINLRTLYRYEDDFRAAGMIGVSHGKITITEEQADLLGKAYAHSA